MLVMVLFSCVPANATYQVFFNAGGVPISRAYGGGMRRSINNFGSNAGFTPRNIRREQARRRAIARENNLKVANKPDSEDICFVPDGNYKKFLENNSELKPKKGNIVNSKGEILGKHTGLYNYTIGQRKGLGISYKVPLFVLGFNKNKNEVIVGEEKELYKKEITVTDINLLLVDEIKEEMEVEVKTRYSSKQAKAKILQEGNNIIVNFLEPQRAITPGQSAVFYVGDIVLGRRKNTLRIKNRKE